jgi:hypothetical protein
MRRAIRLGCLLAAGAALACATLACADLDRVEADQCGNLIVEGGEQCDGDDGAGRCRPPADVDACRYDCREGACPSGLVCGLGEVCWPSGVCGNGVVESEADEECDGDSDPSSCRAPGQVGECRFDCTSAPCPAGYKCLESGLCDDVDVCGNGIAEPGNGEDCDGSAGGLSCFDPGTPNECRFACDASPACPDGYGCGLDGVCRRPAGTFAVLAVVPGESDAVVGAELNGDGRRDLLQISRDAFHSLYLDDAAELQRKTVVTTASPPRVGDVDGDGMDDVVYRVRSKFIAEAGEIAVLRSDGDGGLVSLTHATENLPGIAFSIDAIAPDTVSDLVLFDGNLVQGYSFNTKTDPGNDDNIVFGTTALLYGTLPAAVTLLGAIADYIEPAPNCHRGAIAWRNSRVLRVLTPCNGPFSFTNPPWNLIDPISSVTLPLGHRPWDTAPIGVNRGGAVFFGELDGDGNRDVLVPSLTNQNPVCSPVTCEQVGCFDDGMCLASNDDCTCADCFGTPECDNCVLDGVCVPFVESCTCSDCGGHPSCGEGDSLQVAYGLGDGRFDSHPFPVALADQLTSALPFDTLHNFQCPLSSALGPLGAPTLAVAELDDDVISDFVTGLGIYVSAGADLWSYAHCPEEQWLEAVVGDFDGNATLDVLASSGGTTLDLLSGLGDGSFTPAVVVGGGLAIGSLVAADFDGNGVDDVAFIVHDVPAPGAMDEGLVQVAFGRQGDILAPPVTVTRIRGAARLVAGRFLLQDGAADLAIVQEGQPVAFLRGSATKQFLSTFVLREAAPPPYATFTGVKSFEAVAVGRFANAAGLSAAAQTPLAALTTAADGSQHRLDLVAFDDGGLREVRSTGTFDCPIGGSGCPLWRLVAVDLLDDGQDVEGVVAFRDGEMVVFDQAAPPAESARHTTNVTLYPGRSEMHGDVVGRPIARDVDRDGHPDVAILGADGVITIFWGDGATLSPDSTTTLASTGVPFVAFDFVEADGAVAGSELCAISDGVALHRLSGRSFDAGTALAPDGGMPLVGDVVVGGDLDGDGVDDLAIGSGLALAILRGDTLVGGPP